VVIIAREGFRRGGDALAPFVLLLHSLRQQETATLEEDEFSPELMSGELPSWAFDMYSREGRAALSAFLQGESETAQWVRTHIPTQGRVHFLGTIAFRIEGGLVRSRLRWPAADKLRRLVDLDCYGKRCRDASEVLDLMRRDLPELNKVCARVC
jgi:hypothetical protein